MQGLRCRGLVAHVTLVFCVHEEATADRQAGDHPRPSAAWVLYLYWMYQHVDAGAPSALLDVQELKYTMAAAPDREVGIVVLVVVGVVGSGLRSASSKY